MHKLGAEGQTKFEPRRCDTLYQLYHRYGSYHILGNSIIMETRYNIFVQYWHIICYANTL